MKDRGLGFHPRLFQLVPQPVPGDVRGIPLPLQDEALGFVYKLHSQRIRPGPPLLRPLPLLWWAQDVVEDHERLLERAATDFRQMSQHREPLAGRSTFEDRENLRQALSATFSQRFAVGIAFRMQRRGRIQLDVELGFVPAQNVQGRLGGELAV
jgi:hypothetical protein